MRPTSHPRGGLSLTFLRTIILLSLIWNVVVPVLAEEESTTSAGAPVTIDGAGAGELLRRTSDGLVPLPVLDLRVRLDITGVLVHGTLTETFRNPTDEVIECVYVFPLPEQAAVHHMEMRIGERRIVSVIRERQEARQVYEQAKQEGRKAALLEQHRPNLFTASAANVNPDENVEVILEYFQEVDYRDGAFSLAFPLTFTPRYSLGGPDPGRMGRTFVPGGHAAFPRAAIRVDIHDGRLFREIKSESHAIRTSWEGDVQVVETQEASVPADRDFRLSWAPVLAGEPLPAMFVEDRPDGRYLLLMVLPPRRDSGAGRGLPTETVFVIDVSGSMAGPSLEQARTALLAALDRLRPGDTFDILAFDNEVYGFRPGFVPAGGRDLDEASSWVRALKSGGGTRIDLALGAALAIVGGAPTDRQRRIVFLTDGAVDGEDGLLPAIRSGLGGARLHTLGIGAAPNRYLMRKFAAAGRGLCDFISSTEGAQNRVARFFERLDRPVMTDLAVAWNVAGTVEASFSELPDLHQGDPLVLSARLPAGAPLPRPVLTGRTTEGEERLVIDAVSAGPGDSGIATRWARARVESLLDGIQEGGDPDRSRGEVIDVAKAFRIVTPYTSLVAVEEFPTARADARRVDVANGLPDGSQLVDDLPRGGTDGPLLLLLGSLGVLAGGVLLAGALRRRGAVV